MLPGRRPNPDVSLFRSPYGSALQNQFGNWPLRQNPPPAPVSGLGGAKDRNLSYITGVGNRSNQWGPPPYVCGRIRVYPVISANPKTAVQGNEQWATGMLCFGYGAISLQDLKIGEVNSTEFGDFSYQFLPGLSSSESQSIYNGDVEELQVGKELLFNKDVIELVPQECNYISIDIQFDRGLQLVAESVDPNTGAVTYVKDARTVHFDVYTRPLGGSTWTIQYSNFAITGNTEFTWRSHIGFDIPFGRWQVKVIRKTADNTLPNTENASSWAVLRGIVKNVAPIAPFYTQKGARVLLSHLVYQAKANQTDNGAFGEISGLIHRQIPIWNGSTFVVNSSQNPADYFVDAIRGQVFDDQLSANDIDMTSVAAWKTICSTKGWKINHVFDSEQEIEEVLTLICKTGRATWFMKDGKYAVDCDDTKSTQVQTFTERNSRDYEGHKAHPVIPNALVCRFLNEKNDYKSDVRIVYWDGYSASSLDLVTEEIDMTGVTDPDLIYKHGRYELAVMRNRPETHQVTVDLQHLICNKGDKVRLVNSNALLGLGSALIKEVTTNGGGDVTHVLLDQKLTMAAGSSYDFEIRLADGTFLTRSLVTVEGEFDEFEFLTPIDAALLPASGDMIAFGKTGEIGALQIIQGIEHLPGMEARITMEPYSPEIFAADSGTVPAFDTNVTLPHEAIWELPKPVYSTVRSDEKVLLRMSDGSLQSRIVVALVPPTDLRITHFQFEYKFASASAWLPVESVRVEQGNIVIGNVEDGQVYSIRVRHYAEPGKASAWTDIPDHTVIGKTSRPPSITSLLRISGTNLLKAGVPFYPLDYVALRWFYNLGSSRNRVRAITFANLVTSDTVDISLLPKTAITIGVVMVDAAGLESETVAWATIENGQIDTSNVVAIYDYHPTFPGTHNGVVASNKLFAQDNGGLMWNANESAPMWAADGSTLMWTDTYEDLEWLFNYTPDLSFADKDFRLIMRYGQELVVTAPQGYTLEYKRIGSSLMWEPDGDDLPMWDADDSTLMWDVDDPWAPWTGELDGRVEELQFRLRLFGGSSQPWVELASMVSDVPDVVATIDDAVIANTGTRVSLPVDFRFIRNVNVTLQYSGAHPTAFTWRVVDKNPASGPLIEVLNSSGALTSGIVDVTLRGY